MKILSWKLPTGRTAFLLLSIVFIFAVYVSLRLVSFGSDSWPRSSTTNERMHALQRQLDDLTRKTSYDHRIAFINGHQGTANDFKHVADTLKFHYSLFHGRMLFNGEYGQKDWQADKLNNDWNLGNFFCDAFDIVVVGICVTPLSFRGHQPRYPILAQAHRFRAGRGLYLWRAECDNRHDQSF